MHPNARTIALAATFGLLWILAVGFGVRTLVRYETTPGAVAAVPVRWPAASAVPLSPEHSTLVMLAHPHCPCTRASVDELAQIMAEGAGRLTAYVLFLKPSDSGGKWDDTALRRSAAAIPGVTVVSDPDGGEAQRFGAETSGHTLLFAADGRRLFSGGITQARGHSGLNAGETAIRALVDNQPVKVSNTAVFGCAFVSQSGS